MSSEHRSICPSRAVDDQLFTLLSDRIGEDARALPPGESAVSLGLDSLDYVVMLAVIKDEFGCDLSFPEYLLQQADIADLVRAMTDPVCDCGVA